MYTPTPISLFRQRDPPGLQSLPITAEPITPTIKPIVHALYVYWLFKCLYRYTILYRNAETVQLRWPIDRHRPRV